MAEQTKPKQTSNFTKKEKDRLISIEIKRIEKACEELDEDRKGAVVGLIKEVAFIGVTLEDLKITINRDGCVTEYQNGKEQWGTRVAPEVDIYNKLVKHYTGMLKLIAELMPEGVSLAKEEIMEFISSKPKRV